MSTFKIIFAENNIRRLKLTNLPTYSEFIQNLTQIYPSQFHTEYKFILKYVDTDGDKIAVSTQLEWEEMLQQLTGENTLKIYIEEVLAEPRLNGEEKDEKFEFNFQGVLNQLEDYVAEIQMEIPNMEDVQTGIQNGIQKVKNTVLNVIEDVQNPDDPNTLYLLACAESLLGNVKEGIENLEKAINSGYRDINRLVNDIELDNIKDTLAFSQILDRLNRIVNPVDESCFLTESSMVEVPFLPPTEVVEPLPVEGGLEEKVNKLAEVSNLPKDLLRDLLVGCKEDTDEVMSLIYSTYKF